MSRARPDRCLRREVVENISRARRVSAARLIFDRMPVSDQHVEIRAPARDNEAGLAGERRLRDEATAAGADGGRGARRRAIAVLQLGIQHRRYAAAVLGRERTTVELAVAEHLRLKRRYQTQGVPWMIYRCAVDQVQVLVGCTTTDGKSAVNLPHLLHTSEPLQDLQQVLLAREARQTLKLSNGHGDESRRRKKTRHAIAISFDQHGLRLKKLWLEFVIRCLGTRVSQDRKSTRL